MKIRNIKIKNASVIFDERAGWCVKVTLATSREVLDRTFVLSDEMDTQLLKILMSYTKVTSVNDLVNKTVRIVGSDGCVVGFGSYMEDKFVPIGTDGFMEVTERDLLLLLRMQNYNY